MKTNLQKIRITIARVSNLVKSLIFEKSNGKSTNDGCCQTTITIGRENMVHKSFRMKFRHLVHLTMSNEIFYALKALIIIAL